ncbi:hypothetical protein P389DRAFT_53454 [Cystobasidium minutum MCA 4210]|uniref:uncharacterized protein n=1 Tax=Cystobasidium minutum MCA 4210 TaxID=1397322 RepID=UPI0034CF9587|eukprot:jgi/Rhomi1/53454/CE53453_244
MSAFIKNAIDSVASKQKAGTVNSGSEQPVGAPRFTYSDDQVPAILKYSLEMNTSAVKEAKAPRFEAQAYVASAESSTAYRYQHPTRSFNPLTKSASDSTSATKTTAVPLDRSAGNSSRLNDQTRPPSDVPRLKKYTDYDSFPHVDLESVALQVEPGAPDLGFQDEVAVDPEFFAQDGSDVHTSKSASLPLTEVERTRPDGKSRSHSKKRAQRADAFFTPDDKERPSKKANTGSATKKGDPLQPDARQATSLIAGKNLSTSRSSTSIASSLGLRGSPGRKKGSSGIAQTSKISAVPRYPLPVPATQTQQTVTQAEIPADNVHPAIEASDTDPEYDDSENDLAMTATGHNPEHALLRDALHAASTRTALNQRESVGYDGDSESDDGLHELPKEENRLQKIQVEPHMAPEEDTLDASLRLSPQERTTFLSTSAAPTRKDVQGSVRKSALRSQALSPPALRPSPSSEMDVPLENEQVDQMEADKIEPGQRQETPDNRQVPEEQPEPRPGCLCGNCALPPKAQRDQYDLQNFDEWCEEGKGYIQQLPEVLNKMLELMKSRVQAMSTLASKPEQYKETIIAKQAENETQKLKIKAWKNGLPFRGGLSFTSGGTSGVNTPSK